MKKSIAIVLWIFSISLAIMALALLSASALSAAMLLGCAILIHPLFIEKVHIKRGMTLLLAIGLFIGSVAVFPAEHTTQIESSIENAGVVREASELQSAGEEPRKDESGGLKLIEDEMQSKQSTQATPTIPLSATPTATPSATPTVTPSVTPTIAPSATPSATPTKSVAPTSTPKPTQKPTPTIAAVTRSVGITIVDYSASAHRNSYAFIKIQGMPNSEYTCDVEYKSGYSEADGLGTKRSDASGMVSWRWKVGPRTSLSYTPTIYISGGGDSISVDFEVTE